MKNTREKELDLINKIIAEERAMIKPSGRFFDEIEMNLIHQDMVFTGRIWMKICLLKI